MIDFFRAHPGRSALMVTLMIFAGFAEGVGVVALLPLIETVTAAGGTNSFFTTWVRSLFEAIGVEPTLGPLLVFIVTMMSGKAVLLWLARRQVGYTVARVVTDLRLRLVRAVMRARWEYLVSHSSGEFVNAVASEAMRTAGAYRQACAVLAGAIQVGVYVLLGFLVSPVVALMAVPVGVLLLLMMRGFSKMAREAGRRQTRVLRSMIRGLTEVLPGLKPVKAMGREATLQALLEAEAREFEESHRREIFAVEFARTFREPVFVLVLAAGLWTALALGGMAFTTVSLLAVVFYRILFTLGTVQRQYQEMLAGESAYRSLRRRVDEAEAMRERDEGRGSSPPLRRSIRIERVSFAYEPDEPVLEDVTLEIPAGAFVVVTGPSGVGKTTLIDLLTGLVEPAEGRILVDDVPLDDLDPRGWRSRIGYVPQERLLFHSTVYDNVTLGDSGISREEVRDALESAGAWEFVSASPAGMDHVVGELGGRLSGGQGQRIMIARALARHPDLLILDEATASLDPETEAAVCDTLRDLRGELTIVAVAHGEAVRKAADLVVRVEAGGVQVDSATAERSVRPPGASAWPASHPLPSRLPPGLHPGSP